MRPNAQRGDPKSIRYQLGLHFLGISAPGPGFFEHAEYEFILQAGDVAKRLKPRLPPPPLAGLTEDELRSLLPVGEAFLRIEERTALRLPEPVDYFSIDVWEERSNWLNTQRKLLGQCYIPLEQRFNKRLCTWSIVKEKSEVGLIICRFFLGTTPAPVRGLHVVRAATRSSELRLVWELPTSDGDLPLRGYRIEAREQLRRDVEPRTASAPASSEPGATLTHLSGNTVYVIRVWAVNEAGAGPAAEVMGQTGPISPGLCGAARGATEGEEQALVLEWEPPSDNGGADLVAYRVWLRPVFQDGLGGFFPATNFIDLGLFEHVGHPGATQRAPVRVDQLPSCSGCLCSVAAINSAGLSGQSLEAPVVWAHDPEREKEIFEGSSSMSEDLKVDGGRVVITPSLTAQSPAPSHPEPITAFDPVAEGKGVVRNIRMDDRSNPTWNVSTRGALVARPNN
ncbi:unnamed protein product [Durusdinium trenchii]|uniref:Fibronectin type-III domain-containing protein n=1 Tax=Durusdinium trenchii TaxID=1381693 RepID=A0ABP0HYV4_9DINO